MRTAELLYSMAKWLENADNEAIMLAENDEHALKVVADACVLAAALLKTAADEVDLIEPADASVITSETLEECAAIATAFDASDDPALKKMASVFDELILSIAAPPGALAEKKAAESMRIEELRRKYQGNREEWHKINKTDKTKEAIEKSQMTSAPQLHERPLKTRCCPDHPGAQMQRVAENVYMCEMDKKQYNYETGYTLESGEHVPGGSVDLQTANTQNSNFRSIFDTRSGRLNINS
jgi:hypothetical protein